MASFIKRTKVGNTTVTRNTKTGKVTVNTKTSQPRKKKTAGVSTSFSFSMGGGKSTSAKTNRTINDGKGTTQRTVKKAGVGKKKDMDANLLKGVGSLFKKLFK